MKIAAYFLSAALGLLGLLFLVAAGQGNALVRIVIGLVCLLASGAMAVLARMRPVRQTHVHQMKLDLTGDMSLEQIACRRCGAELSSKSVRMAAGAVFVRCEYCDAEYQLEEAPKW